METQKMILTMIIKWFWEAVIDSESKGNYSKDE